MKPLKIQARRFYPQHAANKKGRSLAFWLSGFLAFWLSGSLTSGGAAAAALPRRTWGGTLGH
eukprot:7325674-Alexandrium_andersonii.AAC.1